MIVTQREVYQRTDRNRVVPLIICDDDGSFGNSANSQDCDIGLVDNRQAEHCTKTSWIGDGDGRALEYVRGVPLVAATFVQVGYVEMTYGHGPLCNYL